MRKVVLYIAQSMDGFIARKDGSLDWLTSIPNPKEGDYGYQALLERIDTLVMGRKTYEELLKFGIEWPYQNFQTYVVTKDSNYRVSTPVTCIVGEEIVEIIREIKQRKGKDIWLVGGGELNALLLRKQMVDEIIVSILPRMIGEGIPLIGGNTIESEWELVSTRVFETGLVNIEWKLSE